jgi:hypothetical protein
MSSQSKHSINSSSLPSRAARIKTALKTQAQQDEVIARELRAAKKEFKGDTKAWLAWCRKQFGWGEAMAYRRLDPRQMQEARDAQKVRDTRKRSLQPVENDAAHEAAEDDEAASTPAAAKKRALAQLDRGKRAVAAVASSLDGAERRHVWLAGRELVSIAQTRAGRSRDTVRLGSVQRRRRRVA